MVLSEVSGYRPPHRLPCPIIEPRNLRRAGQNSAAHCTALPPCSHSNGNCPKSSRSSKLFAKGCTYNRGNYWDERVRMAQWWSDYLDALREGRGEDMFDDE